jgi:putative ABC transport system substrate-binding protein
MKTRREVVLALGAGALTLPLAAFAQRAAETYRIGFLAAEAATDPSQAKRLEVLQSALRDIGYTEGKNIVIETRWAEGQYDRLPALASELIALKVSLIVTSGTKATLAAKKATATIPIVMGSTGDPVGLGFTTNLARPSGNITGSTNIGPELGGKLLELLKEAVPRVTQVAYLVNPADPPTYLPAIQTTAASLGLTLSVFEARTPKDFDATFAKIVKARSDALVVQGDTLFAVNVQGIAQLALKHRLASASTLEAFAEAGGLITYGPDRLAGYRRAAVFVDKILKGAKPGDLPIEQPSKFELIINTRTAKSLGVTIPQGLQLRARLI